MTAQAKERDRVFKAEADKEIKEEMIGVLTAISIVSKRLAKRLLLLDEKKKGENADE